jgi:alpha-glucosidase
VIKTALINRYSLIHYYYSSFHSIYEFGGSFFKPLFYEFQNDVKTFDETMIKNNILLGEGLKASI